MDTPGPVISAILLGTSSNAQDVGMSSVFAMRLKSMTFFGVAALLDENFLTDQSFSMCQCSGPSVQPLSSQQTDPQETDVRQRIDQSLSSFIEALPGLTYQESAHGSTPPANDTLVNPDIIITYMLAYSAKIRLHSFSNASSQTCLDTALLMGRLVTAFDTVPEFSVAPLVVVSINN
jgi:hypothetical protein